jgi:hypothetical protein
VDAEGNPIKLSAG